MATFTFTAFPLAITITVRGVSVGDVVRFFVRTDPGNVTIIDEQHTATSTSITKTFEGLEERTDYAVNAGVVTGIDTDWIGTEYFTTPSQAAADPGRTTGIGTAPSHPGESSISARRSGTTSVTGSTNFGIMMGCPSTISPGSIAEIPSKPALSTRRVPLSRISPPAGACQAAYTGAIRSPQTFSSTCGMPSTRPHEQKENIKYVFYGNQKHPRIHRGGHRQRYLQRTAEHLRHGCRLPALTGLKDECDARIHQERQAAEAEKGE